MKKGPPLVKAALFYLSLVFERLRRLFLDQRCCDPGPLARQPASVRRVFLPLWVALAQRVLVLEQEPVLAWAQRVWVVQPQAWVLEQD